MWIDSHCHLDGHRFDSDRDEVIERALAAGVTTMLGIGTGDGPPDLDVAIRLAEKYACLFASAGVHPHDAAKWTPDCRAALRDRMDHPRVLALGEIGLDYHYDFSPRDVQHRVFIEQLEIAADAGKPILIHTREAWDDTFRLLEQYWKPTGLPGVMHCFSGGPAEAERSLGLGFTISFAGIVTYPKAPELREAALLTPLDRMLVETDAPYLAPVPMRGKRNEPAFVVRTGETLAELLGLAPTELARCTSENFHRLFPAAASI
ncbi:MAG TPA: TatD family hydrolase [Bryobacteraceae bacterium]|nr:TatD family hydrolase [Bryobacteraceae bacterium]